MLTRAFLSHRCSGSFRYSMVLGVEWISKSQQQEGKRGLQRCDRSKQIPPTRLVPNLPPSSLPLPLSSLFPSFLYFPQHPVSPFFYPSTAQTVPLFFPHSARIVYTIHNTAPPFLSAIFSTEEPSSLPLPLSSLFPPFLCFPQPINLGNSSFGSATR